MARNPDEIIKSIIGEQVVQLAVLTARVEALEEQLKLASGNRTIESESEKEKEKEKK